MAGGYNTVLAARQILPVVAARISSSSCMIEPHYSLDGGPWLLFPNVTPMSFQFWSMGGFQFLVIELVRIISFWRSNTAVRLNCTCENVKSKVQPLKCRSNTNPSI